MLAKNTKSVYIKDENYDELLKVSAKDGSFYGLRFEKLGKDNNVKFFYKYPSTELIEVDLGKLKPSKYNFVFNTAFAVRYDERQILLFTPKLASNKFLDIYLLDLLHELGHANLHDSRGDAEHFVQNELEAWMYALNRLKEFVPWEMVDAKRLINHIIDCLTSYKKRIIRMKSQDGISLCSQLGK